MAERRTLTLSYYPWITQNVTPQDLRRWINDFATVVAKELNRIVANDKVEYFLDVQQPMEVPLQIDRIVSGASDIALMNPLGYVFARARDAAAKVDVVAVALRETEGKVAPTYYSQLYAAKKSAIRLDDEQGRAKARGRSIGFGAPYSTSNFLVPADHLASKIGMHPFASFSRVEFLGGHDVVARAVYDGKVDIGAGHDGVIKDLAAQYGYGDAEERLVRLARSADIPSDPIVIHGSGNLFAAEAKLKEQFVEALVAAGKLPEGQKLLALFWGLVKGLEPITGDKYDVLEQSMKRLGLRESDLLR